MFKLIYNEVLNIILETDVIESATIDITSKSKNTKTDKLETYLYKVLRNSLVKN